MKRHLVKERQDRQCTYNGTLWRLRPYQFASETTMNSVRIVVESNVNNIKIWSVAQQCFFGNFMTPTTMHILRTGFSKKFYSNRFALLQILRKTLLWIKITGFPPTCIPCCCCILILSKFFYPPTDAQLNCLKNNFKIYIKIYIETAPTCFGAITIIRQRISRATVCFRTVHRTHTNNDPLI
jgi:hypothetical protein